MPVLGSHSVTLEVPNLDEGIRFYRDAGLEADVSGDIAHLRCMGQEREAIVLLGGHQRKRLHHVTLRADGLEDIALAVPPAGGKIVDPPEGFPAEGLWLTDPNGMLIRLLDCDGDIPLTQAPAYEINGPGRTQRIGRSAMKPHTSYPPASPLRLGHVLVFTPDTMKSVRFVTEALGMGLADRAQDVIAFTCAVRASDHHVLAFAKSPAVGFHHASFQVVDPDEVGRNGCALAEKAGRGDWGFGRHTIGSNFFHYIQDPWGSWFEYYADMDFIDDHSSWTPKVYEMEDSLANWGPQVPQDFVHNWEVGDNFQSQEPEKNL
jgi:catechol 2,3-dioxygenase-like lactoylglutathione lyase family enzyme